MQEQKYLPVNWIDGMKVNKSHFVAQDHSVIYRMAQGTASHLNEYNYGLLPAADKNMPGANLYLSIDNQQQVHLRLLQCQAVTRGGYIIQFDEDTSLNTGYITDTSLQLSIPIQELKRKDS